MSDKKGGYRLVSLKLIELSTMTACAGLYQAIESSHDKPLCLCDILVSGAKKNNVYVTAIKGTNKYTLKNVYGYDIEVTNADAVEVTPNADGIELPAPSVASAGKIVGVSEEGKYELEDAPVNPEDAQSGTIQDALGLDSQGKLVKGAVSGGTKLYRHTFGMTMNNTSYAVQIISNKSTAYANPRDAFGDGYAVERRLGTGSAWANVLAYLTNTVYFYDTSSLVHYTVPNDAITTDTIVEL